MAKQKKNISSNLVLSSRSFLRGNLEVGDMLIAKTKCRMNLDGKEALTIGKEYPIAGVYKGGLSVIDNQGQNHIFRTKSDDEAYWGRFFKRGAKKNGR